MGKGQTRSGFRVSAIAAALALSLPAASFGAGLGKLTVLSGLGEPLRAEVELNASKEELATLSAKLAPPAAFRAAGIDISSALRGMKVAVVNGEGGRSTLNLSTDYSVSDPFVDLLLEINWSAGRLVREFTFLLDPPDDVSARTPVAPIVPRGVVSPPSIAERRPAVKAAEATAKPAEDAEQRAAAGKPKHNSAAMTLKTMEKPVANGVGASHKVRPGETLAKIAYENRPEGVSLDQMLLALVRGNPDAFDNGNINRLRAGRILQLPDADSAKAVSPEEAHKQIVAQSTDFNAYRRKLAAQVGAAPAPKEEAAKQGASGKLSARVEDKLPAPADKGDRLKVSRADTPQAGAGAGAAGGKPGAAATDEQLVAREKALKEANSRLAEVEKNVKELQQLVEMKNQALADLQKQAGSKSAVPVAPVVAAAKPAPVPPSVTPAAPAMPPAAIPAPVAQPAPAVPPAQPPKPAVKKPVLPPVPQPEPPSFIETLVSDSTTLAGGGGILALVLGYFGYKGWKRRKEEQAMPAEHSMGPLTVTGASGAPSIFGNAGGRSVDTSASAIQTDFSQSGLSAIDTDEGVDPVAEADVYMAYGRDAQAEEILLDALKSEPERHAIRLKLLEIYAQRRNMLQFETVAGELYAHTGGAGSEWEKASTLGRKLDPHNPLYARTAKEEPVARPAAVPFESPVMDTGEPSVAPGQDSLRSTWTMPGELEQIAAAVAGGAAVQAMAGPATVSPLMTPAAPQLDPVADLDFDLGLEFSDEDADQGHDASFDSTVVLGGPRAGFSMDSLGASEFRIDLDEHLGDLKLPEDEESSTALDQTDILGFNEEAEGAGLDLDLTSIGAFTEASVPEAHEELLDLDLSAAAATPGKSNTENPALGMMDLERTEVGGNLLDFELGDEEPAQQVATSLAPVIDLSDISFDLQDEDDTGLDSDMLDLGSLEATSIGPVADEAFDEFPESAALPPAAMPAAAVEPEIDPAVLEETATKLELAQAYEEMGDREGARELLQEVVNEGSSEQKNRAQDALARIG